MSTEMLGGKAKCRSGSSEGSDESEGLMDSESTKTARGRQGVPKAAYVAGILVVGLLAMRYLGSVRACAAIIAPSCAHHCARLGAAEA